MEFRLGLCRRLQKPGFLICFGFREGKGRSKTEGLLKGLTSLGFEKILKSFLLSGLRFGLSKTLDYALSICLETAFCFFLLAYLLL